MAGCYLQVIQGDTYQFQTNVALDGSPVDLGTATLWFLAKSSLEFDESDDVIINASTSNGMVTVSGNSNSTVTVTLEANFTANLEGAPLAFWALKCQTLAGNVYTLDRGRIAVVRPLVFTD